MVLESSGVRRSWLQSKESSSSANASFRVYYGVATGAVPFLWESEPGTPKHTISAAALPALSPPPSYFYRKKNKDVESAAHESSSSKSLVHHLLRKMMLRRKFRKASITSLLSPSSSTTFSCSSEFADESPTSTSCFRLLGRQDAWICGGDTGPDGSIGKPWSICSVEQVEDLKALLRVFPLWSSAICLGVSIGMQLTISGLQALTMDRSLGPSITVPVGTFLICSFVATLLTLFLLDRFFFPLWHKLAARTPTTLQRIGLGHAIMVASMAASALVERKRASVVHPHHAEGRAEWTVPMSALWLLLPLGVAGVSDAFHFPAQVALYYQAFPGSKRNTATGVMALIIARICTGVLFEQRRRGLGSEVH
ncbi:protein NRT1/ PTR FAMILY 2.7-like [Canna indica]|uniref:Protein NRT1/ PTR FAMILY 2.7-like n=1 Tax=Canna indica TaxID=4628 RepID=A0AAQ3QLK2_9LILI|nr:protein NRT1/ PTR FAMILY 2.7-like [Canna indica]